MTTGERSSYDDVPYTSLPFPKTHPDRLAAVAALFGLDPPPLAQCRVLEVGCASGGNVIPMAVSMPAAQFVGVDLSKSQIAEGQAMVSALGLRNIELRAASITDIDAAWGEFDFIVAHGVFSWVPETVRAHMFGVCARQLAPNGVVFISYNTLPGWHTLGMLRELIRFHTAPIADARTKIAQARAIADLLLAGMSATGRADPLLESYVTALRTHRDDYVMHEYLEETNDAVYFHDFVARAQAHGLQYLADADFGTMLASNVPPPIAQLLGRLPGGVVRQEQYMDFLRTRTFRQSLLVRAHLAVDRKVAPERLRPLQVSGRFERQTDAAASPGGGTAFRGANDSRLQTSNVVTAAAAGILTEHWPMAVPFDDLLHEAVARLAAESPTFRATDAEAEAMLAADLLQCFGAGMVQLHSRMPLHAGAAGERPRASPLARLQAQRQLHVTNLRHEPVRIDSDLARLMQLVDGTRTRPQIEATAVDWARTTFEAAGNPVPADLRGFVGNVVGEALRTLADSALLLE